MKKTAKKTLKKFFDIVKKQYLAVLMFLLLIAGLVIYFSYGKVLPNDKISYPEGSSVAMLLNENPTFKVGFGNVEEPEKQWVRFEADTSLINPFKNEEVSIFKKIANLFRKKERKGIEMSLVNVDLEDTKVLGKSIKSVVETIGNSDIKTTTELTSLGREFYSNKDNVSKQTVRNSNVTEGVDIEYQILEGYGLKEEIVLRDLDAYKKGCEEKKCKLPLNQFEFELKLDKGVTFDIGWYTVEGKSSQTFFFLDDEGNYIGHFLPSWAVDGIGNKTYDVELSISGENGEHIVVMTVDSEWLLSKDRVFPIRIDPSIVHDDQTDFDKGMYERVRFESGPKLEMYPIPSCSSGGTITYSNGYKIHTFTSSGILTCENLGDMEVLIVAGGGGGGSPECGGGGGGGGVVYYSNYDGINNSMNPITVGTGGSGGTTVAQATNGSDSSAFSYTATGGGYGGGYNVGSKNGGSGGSGGGGARSVTTGGSGIVGQGNDGGDGISSDAGGGGGKGVAGADGVTNLGGKGGDGLAYMVSGSVSYYSGGGGGSSLSGTHGIGGSGGGGNGGGNNPGTANTGGGGGGGYGSTQGGAGGSGVVVIRYPINIKRSGTYTSGSIDLGSTTTLSSIAWTPVGINTGDAETPYSTTDLIAQWDFNETSGTTADNEGSCGASCDGTLSGMTTTGQDAEVNSGWTANNRKWGVGALAFDGSNDYVTFGIHSLGPQINGASNVTVEFWAKIGGAYPTAGNTFEILVISNSGGGSLDCKLDQNGKITVGGRSNATDTFQNVISNTSLEKYSWNHVVGIFDYPNDTISIYINGVLDKTQSVTFAATSYTDSAHATWHDAIGNLTSYSRYFNGVMDSTRLYTRALTITEIISNYQSGSIEFEYRTSANGSTWGSWTGGTEVSMETLDLDANYGDGADGALEPSGTFNLNSSTSGARSYADGIAYKIASNPTLGGNSIVTVDTPNGLATGDDILLINLQGSYTDFIDAGNYETLTISSVDTGTKTITTTTNIRKTYQGNTFANQKVVIQRIPNYTSVTLDNTDSITASAWDTLATTPTGTAGYYTGIVAFRANGTVTVGSGTSITASSLGYQGGTPPSAYVGGTGGSSFCGVGGAGGVNGGTLDGTAGAGGGGGADSTGDGALGYCGGGGAGAYNAQPGGAGSVRQGGAGGGGSTQGGGGGGGGYGAAGNGGAGSSAAGSNGGTETSGNGATGPSASIYGNGGGGGGTYGYANLDRLFYGSGGGGGGGYTASTPGSGGKGGGIIFLAVDTLSIGGAISANGANGTNASNISGGGGGGSGGSVKIVGDSLTLGSSIVTATGGVGGSKICANCSVGGSGGSGRIHLLSPVSISGTTSPTATTKIIETTVIAEGTESQSISTSENIVTYQLSSKDISSYTKIPFWVASDKQGNVGNIIYGESLFANYLPDGNTIAFWHMDETANDSCNGGGDVCDSSESNYHGVESGTDILTSGYLGSGRTFTAGDDISLGNLSLVDGLANMTIDAWVYPTQQTAATHYRMFTEQYAIYVGQYGTQVSYYFGNGSGWTTSDTTGGLLQINAWNYVAWVKSGTSASIYINGQLGKSGITAPATIASTTAVNYISTYDGTTQPWIGNLDEVRISNVARTAGEIRQIYEMGSRTHPINVYFKADLQSDNLISDTSDKSFRISEMNYGTSDAIENLNVGDKIVVTESTYKAQGTVDSIDTGTGTVTVSSWNTGSTAPGGGYTTAASVYKWQREYIDTRWHISSLLDGINTITFKRVNPDATILLDDFRAGKYSTDNTAISFTPVNNIRYVQYRAIFSSWENRTDMNQYISNVEITYGGGANPTMEQLMRHGKWFNDVGEKQTFWYVNH